MSAPARRRVHHDQKVSLTKPFDLGTPLYTEQVTPFGSPGGVGILGGVHAAGFDVELLLHGPADGGTRVRWPSERYPGGGEIARQDAEHWWTHQRPDADGWEKNIKIIPSGNGHLDIRAW